MQAPRLEALSVLIVDDSKHMCELIVAMLRAFGIAQAVACQDVASAMNYMRQHNVDIVITDLALPSTTGVEFVHQLRWDSKSPAPFVPVLMVTGYSDRVRVEAARDAGINEFLVKPVTPRALFDRLVALIDSPRAFVRSPTYMGPDRRRRRVLGFQGPYRRSSDGQSDSGDLEV
jgi:two-component system, chemotaxis family, chemotaxis protein CheY